MISFTSTHDSIKIRLAWSKVLLLIILSSNMVTHAKWLYCIKSKKYFVLLKLNYLQSRLDTIYKDHIYHNKQTKTFYRKIKFDLLNFRGGPKWVPSSFDGFFSFFFMKWQCQYKVLCLINCNHEKSTFFKDRHYFIYFYSFSSLAISLPDKDFQNAYCLIIKP